MKNADGIADTIKKASLLGVMSLLVLTSVSALQACDPREKVRRVNSSGSGRGLSTPRTFFDGWGLPRSVEVSNYDGDCFPWVSGNGRYLLFASINFNGPPRPGHQGVWDIYRSEWDSVNHYWKEPENLGPVINTPLDERRPTCNAVCDTIYYHRIGLNGNANIYRSTWDDSVWTTPESLPGPVNTPANEEHPALSADGMRLYFTSDRLVGGEGGKDIWIALWNGTEWDSVVNLGPPVNTPNEETRPFESFDGQRLYFTNQHSLPRAEGCYGGWGDIYVAFWTGSGWDNVSVVAAPVNNDLVACTPAESPDGSQLYFGSESYEGGRGDEDIWVTDWGVSRPPGMAVGYGSWAKTGELGDAVHIHDLKESADGAIYAATACAETIPEGRVFRTTDGGVNWSPCADLPGAMIVYSLMFVENTLYAGTYPNGDVFKSVDAGASWVNTGDLPGVTSVRAMVQLESGDIFVGTAPHDTFYRNRIFRTTDGGLTWTERAALTGINPCKSIYQTSSGAIFAVGWGIDSYIFINRSTDNGATWDSITVVPQTECDWSVDAFVEASDGTLYTMGWLPAKSPGTGGGFIYRSADDGITWAVCSKIMRGDGVHNGRVYSVVEDDYGRIYVGMQPAPDSVVFASSDRGESWYSTGGLDGAFECLCLLHASDGAIYAGTTPNGDVFRYVPPTHVAEKRTSAAGRYQLSQNYPNPFSSATAVAFHVPRAGPVSIRVYDILGQLVRTIFEGDVEIGSHDVRFTGIDSSGRTLADGVYFCRMEADDFVQIRKLLLVR